MKHTDTFCYRFDLMGWLAFSLGDKRAGFPSQLFLKLSEPQVPGPWNRDDNCPHLSRLAGGENTYTVLVRSHVQGKHSLHTRGSSQTWVCWILGSWVGQNYFFTLADSRRRKKIFANLSNFSSQVLKTITWRRPHGLKYFQHSRSFPLAPSQSILSHLSNHYP